MRKASEINNELNKLREYNHENAHKMTAPELRELSRKVRTLQQELSDLYSNGAKPCPRCGAKPIGMDRATKFEVGCTVCPPFGIEVDGTDEAGQPIKVKRRQSFSAQGRTPEEAVENWNDGIMVVDSKLDLLPPQTSAPPAK